jgi:predicted Zn-dependent peptidase
MSIREEKLEMCLTKLLEFFNLDDYPFVYLGTEDEEPVAVSEEVEELLEEALDLTNAEDFCELEDEGL